MNRLRLYVAGTSTKKAPRCRALPTVRDNRIDFRYPQQGVPSPLQMRHRPGNSPRAAGPIPIPRLEVLKPASRPDDELDRYTIVGKMDPPELPNIFRGTALQWRRCVRSCTSTAPSPPMRGGLPGKVDISLETGPAVCTLFAQIQKEGIRESPTS